MSRQCPFILPDNDREDPHCLFCQGAEGHLERGEPHRTAYTGRAAEERNPCWRLPDARDSAYLTPAIPVAVYGGCPARNDQHDDGGYCGIYPSPCVLHGAYVGGHDLTPAQPILTLPTMEKKLAFVVHTWDKHRLVARGKDSPGYRDFYILERQSVDSVGEVKWDKVMEWKAKDECDSVWVTLAEGIADALATRTVELATQIPELLREIKSLRYNNHPDTAFLHNHPDTAFLHAVDKLIKLVLP